MSVSLVSINLLPVRVRRRGLIMAYVLGGGGALVLALALVSLWWVSKVKELDAVKVQSRSVERELRSPELERIVAEVKKFAEDKANLDKQAEKILALRKEQMVMVGILNLLPDIISPKAILQSVNVKGQGPKKPLKVSLKVIGTDREIIPRFYDVLSNSPGVSMVNMGAVGKALVTVGGESGYSFDVSFEVGE